MNILQNIFIFWLGTLPLIVFRNHYEGPKVFIFLLGGFFLTTFWLFKSITSKKVSNIEKSDRWFLIWLATLFISGLFQEGSTINIVRESYRQQGILFFLTLFLVGVSVRVLSKDKKTLLKKVLTTTILLEGMVVVFQLLTKNLYFGLPLGTMGETNAIAGFIAIGIFIAYQILPRIWTFALLIPIILTMSRAGIMSASVFLLTLFNKKVKPALFLLMLLIPLFLVVFISGKKEFSKFENRFLFWEMGISAIKEKPILGFGPESQATIYSRAFAEKNIPLVDLQIDRAHNLFVDILLWSGILGLIPFSLWLISEFKRSDETYKKLALLSFLIFSFFQPLSVVHWVLIMVIFNL